MPKYRISIEKYPTEFFPLEVIEVESREEADEYARRLTVARTRVEPIGDEPISVEAGPESLAKKRRKRKAD